MTIEFYRSDCLTYLRTLPDESVHAVITDPPYGLSKTTSDDITRALTSWLLGDRERVPSGKKGFMGREWDGFVPPPAVWDECLRVLVPGGHMAVFAGSRTVDLMGLSIRLAGFEMRDGIAAWLYGSGFPKSLDVGKAIDAFAATGKTNSRAIRHANDTREVVGTKIDQPGKSAGQRPRGTFATLADRGDGRTTDGKDIALHEERYGASLAEGGHRRDLNITTPTTDAAREWSGWGTALKPAHEPILLARKPLAGTVAANVLAHRAGAINVDATRVAHANAADLAESVGKNQHTRYANPGSNLDSYSGNMPARTDYDGSAGRWPTNVVLAHHPECGPDEAPGPCVPGCQVAALDEQSGNRPGMRSQNDSGHAARHRILQGSYGDVPEGRREGFNDSGGASRFFPTFRYQAKAPKTERPMVDGTGHPTVKPLGLMRWLVRLLVPEDGMILDPFAGSGSTLEAARLEGFSAIGVEADEHSYRLISERLSNGAKSA